MSLLEELYKRGLIGKKEFASLEYEVKSGEKREEEIILEKGIVSEDVLFALKSEILKIPLKEVIPSEIELKVLELIPEETVETYKMIPIGRKGNILEVGMIYPEDLKAREALKFLARQNKLKSKISLITPSTFKALFKRYKSLKKEVKEALEELELEIKTERVEKRKLKEKELKKLVEEAPISKIVAVLLRHAVEGKASDIHIEPTREKLRIRFRLDGILHSSIFLPLKVHPAIVTRIKILSNLKIDESRIPQDGRFTTKVGERYIDFRVSTFPTSLGEKVAIRVLDPSVGLKTFEEIGLEGKNLKILKEALKKPYGLILATGPTGCGKTTTLYAILRSLNKEEVNIVTLEDPIEYFLEGINQSQVRPDIGYDFAQGLRHVLRQDPDIIMVGEIRDEETASLTIHAALTGHIVLSTLHTNNAIGAIPRLIDLKVRPFLIPPSLNIIIAQRLVRRLCPFCKKKKKVNLEEEKIIERELEKLPKEMRKKLKIKKPYFVFKAVGCERCRNEGYIGRTAILEILKMTSTLSEIVLKDPSEKRIEKEAISQGMITMMQDGLLKVLKGITSLEEILRATEEK